MAQSGGPCSVTLGSSGFVLESLRQLDLPFRKNLPATVWKDWGRRVLHHRTEGLSLAGCQWGPGRAGSSQP